MNEFLYIQNIFAHIFTIINDTKKTAPSRHRFFESESEKLLDFFAV